MSNTKLCDSKKKKKTIKKSYFQLTSHSEILGRYELGKEII